MPVSQTPKLLTAKKKNGVAKVAPSFVFHPRVPHGESGHADEQEGGPVDHPRPVEGGVAGLMVEKQIAEEQRGEGHDQRVASAEIEPADQGEGADGRDIAGVRQEAEGDDGGDEARVVRAWF